MQFRTISKASNISNASLSDPCEPEISQGNCIGKDACNQCRPPGGNSILPDNGNPFPNGFLNCEGEAACVGMLVPDVYTYASSTDYLVCNGLGACKGQWNIDNLGSACCFTDSANGQVCNDAARLNLNTDGQSLCTNDICCDCPQECCYESEFTGVNSLSCRGGSSCTQSNIQLDRNLFCNL